MKLFLSLVIFVSFNAAAKIKVTSFNIQNFRSFLRTNETLLIDELKKQDADVISVQEIVDGPGFEKLIISKLPNYGVALSYCGGGGNQKLGFIYNRQTFKLKTLEFDRRFEDVKGEKCGSLRPAVIGHFTHLKEKRDYTFIAVHLKAGAGGSSYRKRWGQYELLKELVKGLRQRNKHNIIMMGDFNTTGYVLKNRDFELFEEMLDEVGGTSSAELTDCTSYWEGEDRHDRIQEPSILDHVVAIGRLQNRRTKVELSGHCKIARCERSETRELGDFFRQVSDHCPVGVTFE